MNISSAPAKRSSYPFSVVLILLVHLALGYMIYQEAAQPTNANTSTTISTPQPEKTVVP